MSVGSVIASVASAPRSAAASASADGGSGFAQTMLLAGEGVAGNAGAASGFESGRGDEQPDESLEYTLADPFAGATGGAPVVPALANAALHLGAAAAGPVTPTPDSVTPAVVPATVPPAVPSTATSTATPTVPSAVPFGVAVSPEQASSAPLGAEAPAIALPTGAVAVTQAASGPPASALLPGLPAAAPTPGQPVVAQSVVAMPPPPAADGLATSGTPAIPLGAAATQSTTSARSAVPTPARGTASQVAGTAGVATEPAGTPAEPAAGTIADAEPAAIPSAIPSGAGRVTPVVGQAAAPVQAGGPGALDAVPAGASAGAPTGTTPGPAGPRPDAQPSMTVTAKMRSSDTAAVSAAPADGVEVPIPSGAGAVPIVTEGRQPALAVAVPAVPSSPHAVPMREQVGKPLLALAAAGTGEHTVTISVTPDALGPVTVRAHISDGQVRLELFAPTDPGRDSLRQLLPDLRRDLASTDMGATLDLSSQSGPPSDDPRQDDAPVLARTTNETPPSRRQSEVGERVGSRTNDSQLALDVLA